MSAGDRVPKRSAAPAARTTICQWERTPQGGLRATWRPCCRVAAAANGGGHVPQVAVRPARDAQRTRARSRPEAGARQRPIERWIAASFIGTLYLLAAFAGISMVVRA